MIDFVRVPLSVVLPPVAVFSKTGIQPGFWLNLILTALGYVAGLAHALWVVGRR